MNGSDILYKTGSNPLSYCSIAYTHLRANIDIFEIEMRKVFQLVLPIQPQMPDIDTMQLAPLNAQTVTKG